MAITRSLVSTVSFALFLGIAVFAGGCLQCSFEGGDGDVEPAIQTRVKAPEVKRKAIVRPPKPKREAPPKSLAFDSKTVSGVSGKTAFEKGELAKHLPGLSVSKETIEGEGDVFVQYVGRQNGKEAITFDERRQRIYSATISSPVFRDKKGLGVSSRYAELKKAYPDLSCERFSLSRRQATDGVSPTDEMRCTSATVPGVRYDMSLGKGHVGKAVSKAMLDSARVATVTVLFK